MSSPMASLNPSDSVVTFMQDVLTEVMGLFPGAFIHIGGDEAIKDQWKASPRVQARIRRLHLQNEEAKEAKIPDGAAANLLYVIGKLKKSQLRRSTLDAASRYWHFMDILWVYLLLLLWMKL